MALLYKHFAPLRTAFCTILLCFAFAHSVQASGTLFTIEGVEVDVTAQNANAARKQAFAEAQTTAFEELSRRMVAEGEGMFLSPPEVSVISSLIQDFEITEEKLSRVRYIGTYTFRFDKKAVREFFSGQGLGYTDVSSRPVMVLPYYQGGARPVLWQGENPFNAAWSSAKNLKGLVPIVVPLGDLADIRNLGSGDALSFDPDGVAAMTARYDAGEAVILLAIPDAQLAAAYGEAIAQGGVSVHIYRTDRGQPEHVGRVDIEAAGSETVSMLYNRAVQQVRVAIQQNWKEKTIVNAAQGNHLQVKVRFGNLQEWAETQAALERVQGINSVKLIRLARNYAIVDLMFQGAERRLRLALAQVDITLTKPRIGFSLTAGMGAGSGPSLLYELYLNRYRPAPRAVQPIEAMQPAAQIRQETAPQAQPQKRSGWRNWF